MPRSTLIYPIPSVRRYWQTLRSLLSLSARTYRLHTLTLTSGGYPMLTGLTMSARISIIPKTTRTRKMLKLTGISLR
jgi:hypothetical protein